jgi:hypothetical protein
LKPLPHEIELQKVLDAIIAVAPDWNVPPLDMFDFMPTGTKVYGLAYNTGSISLNLNTLGEFSCKNKQFVETIVHEVVHVNHWDEGHSNQFWIIHGMLLDKVLNKLNKEN